MLESSIMAIRDYRRVPLRGCVLRTHEILCLLGTHEVRLERDIEWEAMAKAVRGAPPADAQAARRGEQ